MPPGLVGDRSVLVGSTAGVWPTISQTGAAQFAEPPGRLIHRALASRATAQPGAWWVNHQPREEPDAPIHSEDAEAFAMLPEELLEMVFGHLDGGSVLAARLCCRCWAKVMSPAANTLQMADAYPDPDMFIRRFTQLHSWYKHLPLRDGLTMALFLGNGMQPRNSIHPETDGTSDVCWHYRMFALHGPRRGGADVARFATLPAIVRENAVQLNCFVGRENTGIISRKIGIEAVRAFAREFHPQTLSIRCQNDGGAAAEGTAPNVSGDVDGDRALPEEVNMQALYELEKHRLDEEIRTACRRIAQYCQNTPANAPLK